MRKVLIVSHSFPPLHNSPARRYGQMVQFFERYGWQPWVLTAPSEGSLPQPLPEERVVRLGPHRGGSPRTRGKPWIPAAVKRPIQKVRLRSIKACWYYWYRPVRRAWPGLEARLPRFDCIIATYPPPAALWLGRWLAERYDAPWVADFRDPGGIRSYGRPAVVTALDGVIERRLVASAARLVTVGRIWADLIGDVHRRKVEVVYNGWAEDEQTLPMAGQAADPIPSSQDGYVYYAGRLYQHRMEAVRLVLEALRGQPGLRLVVRSLGPDELERELRRQAADLGMADAVDLRPPTDPDTVRRESAGAVANLVLEDLRQEGVWSRGTLTGKLLQLIAWGDPVLCIARPDSEAGAVLEETGGGWLCSSGDEVARALDRAVARDQPPLRPDAVRRYSREAQARRLCGIMDEVVEC